jgi:hypothetical protein
MVNATRSSINPAKLPIENNKGPFDMGVNPPAENPTITVVNGAVRFKISKRGVGILSNLKPTAKATITDSPIAVRIPIIMALLIPEIAEGNVTFIKVCQRLAPREKDASFKV